MKRHSKTPKGTLVTDEVFARLKPYAGMGLEQARNVFLPPWPDDRIEDVYDWYCACEKIDEELAAAEGEGIAADTTGKRELVGLLRSESRPLPRTARECVADLLDRNRLLTRSEVKGTLGDMIVVVEENKSEKNALIRLLQSEQLLAQSEREQLASLFLGFEFKRKRGQQRTPLYRVSDREWELEHARYEVRRLRSELSIDDALARVSQTHNIDLETLRNACEGRRGSSRK